MIENDVILLDLRLKKHGLNFVFASFRTRESRILMPKHQIRTHTQCYTSIVHASNIQKSHLNIRKQLKHSRGSRSKAIAFRCPSSDRRRPRALTLTVHSLVLLLLCHRPREGSTCRARSVCLKKRRQNEITQDDVIRRDLSIMQEVQHQIL